MQFAARSAEENGFSSKLYSTAMLDWRMLPDERYPIILVPTSSMSVAWSCWSPTS